MNNSYYFQHDYSSRSDSKIQKLIYKEKFEGYGLYWALIEMLYINNGYLDLECERIAFDLHSDCDKIKRIIFDYDLFEIKNNLFYSHRILEQINFRKAKSDKAKESANWRWKEKKDGNAKAMRTHSEGNAIKERKGKERKEEIYKENNIKENFKIPKIEEVKSYCLERKNNINAISFFNYYESKGWMIGKNKMKNWKACIHTWEEKHKEDKPSIKDNLHYLN